VQQDAGLPQECARFLLINVERVRSCVQELGQDHGQRRRAPDAIAFLRAFAPVGRYRGAMARTGSAGA
jgi:hypothetical protein